LGGGTLAAESGQYRFRTELVYLPQHVVQTKKRLDARASKVGHDGTCGAIAQPSGHPAGGMCAARYVSSSSERVDYASAGFAIAAVKEILLSPIGAQR